MFPTIAGWFSSLLKMPGRIASISGEMDFCRVRMDDLHDALDETKDLIHSEIKELRCEMKKEINSLETRIEKLQGAVVYKDTCMACRTGIDHVINLLVGRQANMLNRPKCEYYPPEDGKT